MAWAAAVNRGRLPGRRAAAACRGDNAVNAVQPEPDHEPLAGDHLGEERVLVLRPVERRMDVEQFPARLVAGPGSGLGERGVPFGGSVGPEAVTADVQHGTRVPGQVAGLQAVGGGGDAHRGTVGVGHVQDVGQLGKAVALDRGEHALAAGRDQRPQFGLAGHQRPAASSAAVSVGEGSGAAAGAGFSGGAARSSIATLAAAPAAAPATTSPVRTRCSRRPVRPSIE